MTLEEFESYTDSRGKLNVAQLDHLSQDFSVKRVFWITDVPEGTIRGEHANRECTELLVAVSGKVSLWLTDGNEEWNITLSDPNQGLYIPPMVWCKLYDFSSDATIVCMADKEYDPEQYINDYQQFLSEL
jgi:dTDP-4-dehydrorhamnose 3,5-epimerase-like enzyme